MCQRVSSTSNLLVIPLVILKSDLFLSSIQTFSSFSPDSHNFNFSCLVKSWKHLSIFFFACYPKCKQSLQILSFTALFLLHEVQPFSLDLRSASPTTLSVTPSRPLSCHNPFHLEPGNLTCCVFTYKRHVCICLQSQMYSAYSASPGQVFLNRCCHRFKLKG